MINAELEEYQIQYDFHQVKMYNDKFEIKICFESEDVLVFYAKGKGLSLILDTLPQTMYDYSFELENHNQKNIMSLTAINHKPNILYLLIMI